MQIREAEHRHRAELAAEQERVREAHEMVELIQSVVPSLIQFVCFFSCRVSCGCFLKGVRSFLDTFKRCMTNLYIQCIYIYQVLYTYNKGIEGNASGKTCLADIL